MMGRQVTELPTGDLTINIDGDGPRWTFFAPPAEVYGRREGLALALEERSRLEGKAADKFDLYDAANRYARYIESGRTS